MAVIWYFPAMKMNLRRWLSCKGMVFVCVIWSFDDMGLGKQVILSDKKSKGGQWAMNILNNQIGSIYDRQKNLYSKYPRYSQQNAESKKVCEQEKITATSGKDVLGITKGDKENWNSGTEIGFLSAFSNMILAFANNICIIINLLNGTCKDKKNAALG